MKTTLSLKFLLVLMSVFFLQTLARAETPPSWFDVKAHAQQIQKHFKATGKTDLENFSSKKIDVGTHKLTLVTARFGPGNSESGDGYNVTEIYGEPALPPKMIFQMLDKTGCESKIAEDFSAKKLGFINETQIYFVPILLVAPSCPKSEVSSPKKFLVLQEKKNSLEKVYESSISENGKYRIDFRKEIINLEYAKSLNSSSHSVELTWDDKDQKFKVGSEE
jgi:hypothetical protein